MHKQNLRVGDHVSLYFAGARLRALVIEDRGLLGVGGRQLVRIEVIDDDNVSAPPRRFEMPADDLVVEAK